MSGGKHTAPVRGPGHCDDDAAWAEFSRQYAQKDRHQCGGPLTDFALANAVFMADRGALDLIMYQTAAKERIRWLSLRLAEAEARAAAAADLLEALVKAEEQLRPRSGRSRNADLHAIIVAAIAKATGAAS
jgi:hypothetical protein